MTRKGLAIAFLFLAVGCVTMPETGKRVLILTSESEENQMGVQAYQEVLRKERTSKDARLNTILQRVGDRIKKVANRPDYQWQFTLIDSKEQNAFCLPGGKVAFYTGILPIAQNEAGIATVMGHEVAHATQRHGGQRITQSMGTQVGLAALTGILGGRDSSEKRLLLGALGMGATVGVILPFSRDNESEADEVGLKYMAAAGYDPREAVAFWDRFAKATGVKGPPAFLSTHPSSKGRMEALQRDLPKVEGAYVSSPKYGAGEKL